MTFNCKLTRLKPICHHLLSNRFLLPQLLSLLIMTWFLMLVTFDYLQMWLSYCLSYWDGQVVLLRKTEGACILRPLFIKSHRIIKTSIGLVCLEETILKVTCFRATCFVKTLKEELWTNSPPISQLQVSIDDE